MKVAIVGAFAASLEQPIHRHLSVPCDIIVSEEAGVVPRLGDVEVLATMGLTGEMGRASTRATPIAENIRRVAHGEAPLNRVAW